MWYHEKPYVPFWITNLHSTYTASTDHQPLLPLYSTTDANLTCQHKFCTTSWSYRDATTISSMNQEPRILQTIYTSSSEATGETKPSHNNTFGTGHQCCST